MRCASCSSGVAIAGFAKARLENFGDPVAAALLDLLLDAVDGLLGHPPDLPVRELEQAHRGAGDDIGVARPALQQPHLADQVALFDRGDLLAALDDVGRALLDRDQLDRVIALLHQHLALGRARLGGEGRQAVGLLRREVGEDGDCRQPVGVHGGP